MADNTPAKNHLRRTVESSLSDITKPDSINNIIGRTSLDLRGVLPEKNLFIDNDLLNQLRNIRTRLNDIWVEAANQEDFLRDQITSLWTDASSGPARNSLMLELNKVHNITSTAHRNNRYQEYDRLVNCAQRFNLSNSLLDLDINTATPAASTRHTLNLDSTFMNAWAWSPDRYILCDELGNEITPSSGTDTYKLNIWWTDYTLKHINFTAGWMLDCHALNINPALNPSPQEITLSVNAVFNSTSTAVNVNDVNVVCNKKFKLKLNDWTTAPTTLNTTGLRGVEFDRYDSSWTWNRIWSIIETQFTTNRHKREREALARILEKNWGTQYATLNDKQKEDFYQRIRNAGDYFDNILAMEAINSEVDRLNSFRTRFIDDGRDWNKGDNIKSNHNYITYIHNNVSQKVWDFISSRLDHFMWDIDEEAGLKSELTTFINEIENNKLHSDNTVDNIHSDLDAPEHQMDRKRHWYQLTRRKDANYMRFFSWSSTSLKWEVVNVHTNTYPEELDNLEPIKYDMDIKISWRNSIEAEIKIEWEKKPIRIKSWDPAALVRKIMRDGRINHWNARAHMWFNVYKALVKMANEKDISLQYRNEDTDTTRYIDINDWNIVVREVADIVGLWRRNETIIFDQQKFMDSNNFGLYDNNGSLRRWIDELWKHFTFAMNQLHDQYRHWIERKFWTLFNSRNRLRLPASFWSSWLSPIKKLVNLRDVTNFDFNTTVTSKWKNVNIKFSKNKFTINMEWLEKPIVSKDLWKILNKRHKKIRIFDGMERDIVEWIYATLIGKLRENSKIANTDFWVMDNITWNMYVLDRDWKFWMIYKENLDMMPSPLRWKYWRLNHDRLEACTVDWFERWSTEEKELMKNPFLMQRLVKAMNRRLARPRR